MSTADVRAIEPLERLNRSLRRAASLRTDLLALGSEFDRRRDALASLQAGARDDLERREAALDEADEDDRSSALDDYEQAAEKLARIDAWLHRVDEAVEVFHRSSRQLTAVSDRELRAGVDLLEGSIASLWEYQGIRPDSAPDVPIAGASPAVASSSTPSAPAHADGRPPLPPGFRWVPLAEIEEAELAGVESPESFKKVPYTEMRAGLETLKSTVLPTIAGLRGSDARDALRDLDQANGRDYSSGALRVYEAFFGAHDYIYLTRARHDTKFQVTNGRHRIKVARELGWDSIPAQMKDLRADGQRDV